MDGQVMSDEAGSQDNRLSLSIADNPEIKEWEDGKEYHLEIIVRQNSPGEFTVVKAEPTGEAEAGEAGMENQEMGMEDEAEASPGQGEGYGNPAIERLMRGPKA